MEPRHLLVVLGLFSWSTMASPKEQGSSLTGSILGDYRVWLAGATKSGLPLTVVVTKGSLLDSTALPTNLIGATFRGQTGSGVPLTFFIDGAQPHLNPYSPRYTCSSPADDTEYQVSYQVSGGARLPLCGADPRARALIVPGWWNSAGDFIADTTTFTFACVDRGVIAKCFDWCYKPYLSLTTEHAACARMASADYCAQGKSNTVMNTFIDSWDVKRVETTDCVSGTPPPWAPQTGSTACTDGQQYTPMSFEAAWRVGSSSKQAAAICLSKKRWQTMPLRGGCDAMLPDPRVHTGETARYCEDLTPAQLVALGATHFNYSSFYDVGLWRFSDGVDQYTSARSEDGQAPPPDVGGSYTSQSFEGALWHPLRQPTDGVLVYTYTRSGDHWTTSQAPSEPGWIRGAQPEGWVVSASARKPSPTARKLYCFQRPGDHLTTSRPDVATALGYTPCPRFFEGWLPY